MVFFGVLSSNIPPSRSASPLQSFLVFSAFSLSSCFVSSFRSLRQPDFHWASLDNPSNATQRPRISWCLARNYVIMELYKSKLAIITIARKILAFMMRWQEMTLCYLYINENYDYTRDQLFYRWFVKGPHFSMYKLSIGYLINCSVTK